MAKRSELKTKQNRKPLPSLQPPKTVDNFRRREIRPHTDNHAAYLNSIRDNTVTIGVGKAGTGKTYMAVGAAVKLLLDPASGFKRLALTKPVMEAGESLGFLPGELASKLGPHMRPLTDALQEFLSFREIAEMTNSGVIEMSPLAYMRGRTFKNTLMILDEAQNATYKQLKMFLTRLGHGSKMIVNGDSDQSDINASGLVEAHTKLSGMMDSAIITFEKQDIMRHGLVAEILTRLER